MAPKAQRVPPNNPWYKIRAQHNGPIAPRATFFGNQLDNGIPFDRVGARGAGWKPEFGWRIATHKPNVAAARIPAVIVPTETATFLTPHRWLLSLALIAS